MNKLSMQDATFLYSETDSVMNHIASLQQYELPDGVSPKEFIDSLKVYLMDRIHLLPYLTQKVQMIPGGLDHAVWVQDGEFDIKNHVIDVPLDAPGTFDQVQQKVAELHSEPMDRNHPLWCFYVITGLDDGTVAYYSRIHHACVDGMAGQAMTLSLTDTTPEPVSHDCPKNYIRDENPSLNELLIDSFLNLWRFQSSQVDRSLGLVKAATNLTQRAINPGMSFGAFGQQPPKTRLNQTIDKERAYACLKLPFAEVKKIGKVVDASINDVFLTICSGALRSYLERQNELPRQSLIAGCPVAVPREGRNDQGNSVTLMNVDLFTNVSDPRTRLLRVQSSGQAAKEVTVDMAEALETNMSVLGLPALTRAASLFGEMSGMADNVSLPFNVLISNVPGPRETIYSNGAKMLSHFPVSIPAHGLGLNITVQSYTDGLYIGLTACPKAVPDLECLRDDILAAYRDLKTALAPATVSEIAIKQTVDSSVTPKTSAETSTETNINAEVA